MKSSSFYIAVYALLVLIGGFIGFIKAQSTASLVMSVIFAIVLGVGALLLFFEKKIGFALASLATLVLALFFVYRFWMTSSLFPSGVMCFVSIIVLIILFFKRPRPRIE